MIKILSSTIFIMIFKILLEIINCPINPNYWNSQIKEKDN